jgi:hypothetical protein
MLRGSQPILRVLQGFGHDGGLPDDAGAKLDLLFRQTVLGRELADLLPRSPFHDKQLEDAEVVAERKVTWWPSHRAIWHFQACRFRG